MTTRQKLTCQQTDQLLSEPGWKQISRQDTQSRTTIIYRRDNETIKTSHDPITGLNCDHEYWKD
ncbi:hypothetical protein [Bifidobacterium sp. SO1]|uniref:hypothetical protein n=1 Tax=Bifidobacterium sp. SO1 TaxID=2809029 RepID=UPI001BDC597E|nr:hypothetical protein [Bifidobacterium sp. SO1]MBT1162219.1 hypothetical protein [Bifidobacterium sp. SO1]